MRITQTITDAAVLAELGSRLERTRLGRNMTQAQLAREAGVGKPTVERIEAGQPARLITLVRILRVLGLLDGLDRLVPEPAPSPIEQLKLHGRRRRRAAPRRTAREREQGTWRWGDEQ